MIIPLSLQIALRFSNRKQRGCIVSLGYVISTISIALGVAILIIGLSAINGFERELNQRILAVIPHGEIEPIHPPFTNWKNIIKQVKKVSGIMAAAPYINFTSIAEHGTKLQVIQVKGVDPQQETYLSALPHFIQNGAWQQFTTGKKQIIIGKVVADNLNVKCGDWITIMIPNINPNGKLLQPKRIRVVVCGILALHNQLDYFFAIVPLADAQRYLDKQQDISGIAMKINNVFDANRLVRNVSRVINADVSVHSWINTYGYMYRDIQMIRTIMYLAMILVIILACFNIVSTLVMVAKDKSANIAILRTLGAKNQLISAIFIWCGLLAGLTGSAIGGIIGTILALNLTHIVKGVEHFLGYQLLSGNIYFIDFLPTELHWLNVVSVLSITLLISLLASWYPARYINTINPTLILNR